MHVETWIPGQNKKLDQLFDSLREIQYQNKSHRLWKNYSENSFKDAVALTIVFDNDVPEVCSSICYKDHWPHNVLRIYNRTWKCSNRKSFLKTVTPAMGLCGKDQIKWIKSNYNEFLYFISRETDNWQEWMVNEFKKSHDLDFQKDEYKYLTCNNINDDSCWQFIIYNGKEELLNLWKRRLKE
jgi:hypothetical protein